MQLISGFYDEHFRENSSVQAPVPRELYDAAKPEWSASLREGHGAVQLLNLRYGPITDLIRRCQLIQRGGPKHRFVPMYFYPNGSFKTRAQSAKSPASP